MSDEIKVNEKIYNKFKAYADQDLSNTDRAKLTEVQPLSAFSEDIRSILLPFYESNKASSNRFATVLNSIYTQGNNVFIITRRLSLELLAKETNQKKITSSCSESHRNMMDYAFRNKFIITLRDPIIKSKGVTGRTGVYKLIHPDFLDPLIKLIGENAAKANEDAVLEWYDRMIKANQDTTALEQPMIIAPSYNEFDLEMKRKANEIFRAKTKS